MQSVYVPGFSFGTFNAVSHLNEMLRMYLDGKTEIGVRLVLTRQSQLPLSWIDEKKLQCKSLT